MTLPLSQRVPWTRVVAEGVAIIASILIAFALDAAWDRSQERAREREILAALRTEFESNRVELERAKEEVRRQVASLERLLDTPPSEAASMSEEEALDLAGIFMYRPFDPVGAELEAVMASGQFGLLRDAELRRALGGWRVLVAGAEGQAEGRLRFMIELMDLGRGSGVLSALDGLVRHGRTASDLPAAWASLVVDPKFRDAAATLLLVTDSYLTDDLRSLESALDDILDRLPAPRTTEPVERGT